MQRDNPILPIHIPFRIPLPDGRAIERSVWCYVIDTGNLAMIVDCRVPQADPGRT